jgi:ATP-dependent Lon protease
MDHPNPSEGPAVEAKAGESAIPEYGHPDTLLILPVRETVLFPGVLFPISIGRPVSVGAVQQAMRE